MLLVGTPESNTIEMLTHMLSPHYVSQQQRQSAFFSSNQWRVKPSAKNNNSVAIRGRIDCRVKQNEFDTVT